MTARLEAPVVILVGPQMGENVGACARAMLNCGLTELRVVSPRFEWPGDRATATAAGSDVVLERAGLFETTREAVHDLQFVGACTARERDMNELRQTPRSAVAELRERTAEGSRCGLLFGPERSGLSNDDLVYADRLITVPLNPDFHSLNLAQAVLIVAYEWLIAATEAPDLQPVFRRNSRLATKEELSGLFDHIERDLGDHAFEGLEDKRVTMIRNLRNTFGRAALTDGEVRGLHWVIKHLSKGASPEEGEGP